MNNNRAQNGMYQGEIKNNFIRWFSRDEEYVYKLGKINKSVCFFKGMWNLFFLQHFFNFFQVTCDFFQNLFFVDGFCFWFICVQYILHYFELFDYFLPMVGIMYFFLLLDEQYCQTPNKVVDVIVGLYNIMWYSLF